MRALFMRFVLVLALLVAVGCDRQLDPRPPVSHRLYFPTGIAFAPPDGDAGVGALWVANSNFDRRFDIGWVTPLDLAAVRTDDGRSLPPPGGTIPPPLDGGSDDGRPVEFTQLNVPDGGIVTIQSFAGLATLDRAPDPITGKSRNRLFIPSRAENDYLAVMQVSTDAGVTVRCFFSGGDDCLQDSIPLAVEQTPGDIGVPAAPQPYSVTVSTGGDIYVTHLKPASSPAQSITNLQNFLVTLEEEDLTAAQATFQTDGRYVPPDSAFSPIGTGGSNSIVVTTNFLYVSGRGKVFPTDPDVLLRVVDRVTRLTAFPLIQSVWGSIDARGLALRPSDGKRLYLVADNPPTLLVLDINDDIGAGLAPAFTLVRGVPLPAGPNDIQIITREGRSPLVVVSCAIDGSLAFYDDDLGQIVALVPGVGAVPFGIAVDRRGDVARLYVSNFGDGRVAVVDVPVPGAADETNLAPRIVAHVGLKQYCLLLTDDRNCVDPLP